MEKWKLERMKNKFSSYGSLSGQILIIKKFSAHGTLILPLYPGMRLRRWATLKEAWEIELIEYLLEEEGWIYKIVRVFHNNKWETFKTPKPQKVIKWFWGWLPV